MTKEELEKEAEAYAFAHWADTDEKGDYFADDVIIKQTYIVSAEPREKRIAELELKIKHLTEHLGLQAMTALFEQVEEEVKQEQRLNELEKENAELKAGRPKWHDLRKDPNDLPNDDRVVSEQKGENVRYVKFRNKWFYLDRTAEANVIAWCEIPKYTEE